MVFVEDGWLGHLCANRNLAVPAFAVFEGWEIPADGIRRLALREARLSAGRSPALDRVLRRHSDGS